MVEEHWHSVALSLDSPFRCHWVGGALMDGIESVSVSVSVFVLKAPNIRLDL